MNNYYESSIVVGKFQVPHLHDGHIKLLETAINLSRHVIVIICCKPLFSKNLFSVLFVDGLIRTFLKDNAPNHKITITYLSDMESDSDWVENLKSIVNINSSSSFVGEHVIVVGRDSFIHNLSLSDKKRLSYFNVLEIPDQHYSGTKLRKEFIDLHGLSENLLEDYNVLFIYKDYKSDRLEDLQCFYNSKFPDKQLPTNPKVIINKKLIKIDYTE